MFDIIDYFLKNLLKTIQKYKYSAFLVVAISSVGDPNINAICGTIDTAYKLFGSLYFLGEITTKTVNMEHLARVKLID
jgi:hypothetical protein